MPERDTGERAGATVKMTRDSAATISQGPGRLQTIIAVAPGLMAMRVENGRPCTLRESEEFRPVVDNGGTARGEEEMTGRRRPEPCQVD